MANPFDQFDAPQNANPFDRFDAGASAPQAALANQSPSFARQLLTAPVGGAEMLLRRGTGVLAAIPSGLAYGGAAIGRALGADVNPSEVQGRVQEYLTYDPMSQSGQAGEQKLKELAAPIVTPIAQGLSQAATRVGQVSPTAETLLREAPAAMGAAGGIVPGAQLARAAVPNIPGALQDIRQLGAQAGSQVAQTGQRAAEAVRRPFQPLQPPEEVLARMQSSQSMGAAGAAPGLANVSPELRRSISVTARKTGGIVNPEVLSRHIEADTLPVPVRLTEGQASQNSVLLSEERNLRGAAPQFGAHFDAQGRQLAQNVQALRDRVGPEVFSTNPVEHADTLIGAYRELDRVAQDRIRASYQALRDANGGNFPVDAPALLSNASQALHRELLFDHAPKAVMSTLNRLADADNMTFENFESLRTNLARIQRTSTDGNEVAAAGVIRNAMESLPLRPGAAQLKPLADQARSAARAHFENLRADPAYEAAVDGRVPPDRFAQRFVLGAPRDQLAVMRQNLSGDERALQTMGVIAIDYLRDQARLGPHYEGNFASASFNKAYQGLTPKLASLVDPRTAEDLEKLGNVSRYISAEPPGAYTNRSNTFTAGAANATASAAEGAANVAAAGIPVGTWTRKGVEAVTRGRRVKRALAPGAGLDVLQTSPQVEAMLEAARNRAARR